MSAGGDFTVWKPASPPQAEILMRKEFELGIGGSRGGGKTEVLDAWLLERKFYNDPNYNALVLRKQAKALSGWVTKFLEFARGAVQPIGGNNVTKFLLPAGGKITLGHLNDAKSHEAYQGHQYHKINFEELCQIADETVYDKVIMSCRSTDRHDCQVASSFNPGGTVSDSISVTNPCLYFC